MKNFVSSNIFPRWLSFALGCLIAQAAGLHAETGTVQGTRCNVRALPETKAEVVTQLNKGDTVTILEHKTVTTGGQQDAWLRIAMPPSGKCFVSAQFVKDGVITGDDLYVRCGPGTRFREVGKLPKGHKVEIVATQGEWVQIKPTSHCSAWISADLVAIELPAAPPVPAIVPAPIAPAETPAATKEPSTAVERPPMIVAVTPAPAAPAVQVTETGPAEFIHYAVKEGILKSVPNAESAPGAYQLMTMERNRIVHRICYLDTTKMNLGRFENKKVRVFGNIRWREKERDPVMIVERVDMVW
jgi:uncharacterized protein YraI